MFLERSAIILANESSKLFSEDIGLLKIGAKPLISHVIDAVKSSVEEVIIVTNSERAKIYPETLTKTHFIIIECESDAELPNALAGFKAANGKYALLLPFDAPFVSKKVISLLFDCCIGKTAVVPRWSSDTVEPLQAVYQVERVLKEASVAVEAGETDLSVLVERLRGVRYISSLVFEQIEPEMRTFFRIRTPLDFKKAMSMFSQSSGKVKQKK